MIDIMALMTPVVLTCAGIVVDAEYAEVEFLDLYRYKGPAASELQGGVINSQKERKERTNKLLYNTKYKDIPGTS